MVVRDWVRDAFPGREYTGEVYAVDPGLDPATRSVKFRARLPNPNPATEDGRPDMSYTLYFPLVSH
jgi:multidrug efflux pump subunit AcrA (membrane-fusion protein)